MNDVNNSLENQFFSVSIKKLCVMYFFTFGMYVLVFFYKNWSLQKFLHKLKVLPAARSIFYIFFTHSLFARIRAVAGDNDISGASNFGILATIFVLLNIVGSLISLVSQPQETLTSLDLISVILVMLALLPLIIVQNIINKINQDNGNSNSRFTVYNWIFIVIGAILWLGLIASFFMPEQPIY